MKILVIGAGEVGFQLASMLSREEHEVTVIENDEERVLSIKEKIDARFVIGSGTNSASLEEAEIEQADLFIAVSSVDEVNIMSCLIAKEYGVERSVARVMNNDYVFKGTKLYNIDLGIERIVNPQQEVAKEVSRLCDFSDASEVADFCGNDLLHLGYPIRENNPLIGNALKGFSFINGEKKMVITSLVRNDETFIPKKDQEIQQGDMIYFFCLKSDLKAVREHFGILSHGTKKIFIIGGGRTGYQVASHLEKTNHKVKVFDRDMEICTKIANELDVDVFCTHNTDVETLEQEGIDTTDVVVTMMDDDYTNILTALLAKKLGAFKSISLVSSKKLTGLAYSLGVDSTVSPRLTTASSILKYIRRGKIISVVEKAGAEILEVELIDNIEITLGQIKDIRMPKGVIFGGIKREGEVKLLSGDDQLQMGDVLVVYSLSKSIPKLETLLDI